MNIKLNGLSFELNANVEGKEVRCNFGVDNYEIEDVSISEVGTLLKDLAKLYLISGLKDKKTDVIEKESVKPAHGSFDHVKHGAIVIFNSNWAIHEGRGGLYLHDDYGDLIAQFWLDRKDDKTEVKLRNDIRGVKIRNPRECPEIEAALAEALDWLLLKNNTNL